MDTTFAILGAGPETTINFFDSAVTAMLTNTEQLALVKSVEVSWDAVIEEVLRVESPLASLRGAVWRSCARSMSPPGFLAGSAVAPRAGWRRRSSPTCEP